MTLWLITLGVYTAATGSGLACNADWPLCSGQLVPALTINPDFIEWFHRLVAMITGLLILATAAWAWLGDQRRQTKLAATLAVVVLPVQISIGAVTVTIGGLVPGGYAVPTHAAHLLVALVIFTLLVLTTLWAYQGHFDRPPRTRLRSAFGVAAVGMVVSVLFSRALPILVYDSGGQAWYFVGSLLAYAGLVAAITWSWRTDPVSRAASVTAIASLFVTMLLGRDIVVYGETARLVNVSLLVVAASGVLVGLVWSSKAGRSRREGRADRMIGPN
ncbi:MAG: COX15/CtaA family protein [Halobacteriota archaeon]